MAGVFAVVLILTCMVAICVHTYFTGYDAGYKRGRKLGVYTGRHSHRGR